MDKLIQLKSFHDKLFKKEQISPIEKIYNEHNRFKDNVVRRPALQCLGNLNYYNISYDPKFKCYFRKDKELKISNHFIITEEWKDRVRCFIIWNFGFGRYMPYNDFVDAMYYDYLRFGRRVIPNSKKLIYAEEMFSKRYVRSQISLLRKKGYVAYRDDFKKERPDLFIGEKRRVFRCLDTSLSREQKIQACRNHRRMLWINILDGFINKVKKHPSTAHTWFDEKKDSQGFNRICLSQKAIDHLNKRREKNGLTPISGERLSRMFNGRVKEFFGKKNKNYNIKTFIQSVVESAEKEEQITKAIKKIKNIKLLKIYNKALVSYRRAAANFDSMLKALDHRAEKTVSPPIAS